MRLSVSVLISTPTPASEFGGQRVHSPSRIVPVEHRKGEGIAAWKCDTCCPSPVLAAPSACDDGLRCDCCDD